MEYDIFHYAAEVAGAAIIALIVLTVHARMREFASRRALRDISEIYETMLRLINRTGADRVLILGLHNGGHAVQVHSKRYITIFEEVNSNNVPNIREDYERYRVDGAYITTFRELMDKGHVSGPVAALPPGMLRDAYTADGIEYYHLFYIGWKSKIHFFGSISSTTSAMEDPQSYTEINVARSRIRRLMMGRRIF